MLDGYMNGTGLPPKWVRISLVFNPGYSIVKGGKTIVTGEDLFNNKAEGAFDRYLISSFNIFAPFLEPFTGGSGLYFILNDLDILDKGKDIKEELERIK
jgi:hypothetical protein